MKTKMTVLSLFLLLVACGRGEEQAALARSSASAATDAALATAGKPLIHVWKSASCGCCSAWVAYVKAAGYPVQVEDVDDIDAVKRKLGVPAGAAACHTALVDGYVLEGHVPSGAIDRMLADRPKIGGIAVPGMPMGAPGMASPGQEGGYDVVTFTRDGTAGLYERH